MSTTRTWRTAGITAGVLLLFGAAMTILAAVIGLEPSNSSRAEDPATS
ncbi:hypothetical protein [Microbacterium sp. 22242]